LRSISTSLGLIPFYRGGAGLPLTAVAAAVAAFESAENPNSAAEGLLLSIGAWVPVVLVLIAILSITRGLRAVVYIRTCLIPLAHELAEDDRLLLWELTAEPRLAE
jgi:hypothetical protein